MDEDLKKINSYQLYLFWKNFSIAVLVLVGVLVVSKLLPYFLAPVVALGGVAVLYTLLYNRRFSKDFSCQLASYSLFICLIAYTFISIILNILFIWKIIYLPKEFIFFSDPFIPGIVLVPVFFVTLLGLYLRRNKLSYCKECKLRYGDYHERGMMGRIIRYESNYMLANLVIIFGFLSVVIWVYYLGFYKDINQNSRDWYIFFWLIVIVLLFDEVFLAIRYYNLYLDLKENDEIASSDDLSSISSKIYLRYYVVCGDNTYLDTHVIDPKTPYREVIDTPFVTKRSVTGITIDEVKKIVARLTGVDNGELRFFFGRRSAQTEKRSILRYFYFLDGSLEDYKELKTAGEWMDFTKLKKIYSTNPARMADGLIADITRLATIMITSKVYNEHGIRKSKIKSYNPSFDLLDVRDSDLDFQDDKWVKISMFNSDVRFFRLRRWWRRLVRSPKSRARTNLLQ